MNSYQYIDTFDDQMGGNKHKLSFSIYTIIHLIKFPSTKCAPIPYISVLRNVLMIDASRWQGVINFIMMVLGGVHGIILKASQADYPDPMYATNSAGAKAYKLPQGSYHYYDSRVDPKVQAARWANTIKDDQGQLPHFIDLEESYGGQFKGWRNWKICIIEFMRLSKLPVSRVGIYTAYYYWIANAPTDYNELLWFKQFMLWLAWYTSNPANVLIPKPWGPEDLWAWQYGTVSPDGTPRGEQLGAQSKEIDESNVNMPLEQYAATYNLDLDPEIPTGEDMSTTTFKVTVVSATVKATSVIVRATPNGADTGQRLTSSSYILYVLPATTTGGHNWVKVFAPVIGWVARDLLKDRASGDVEFVVTDPTPVPVEDIQLSIDISGYEHGDLTLTRIP